MKKLFQMGKDNKKHVVPKQASKKIEMLHDLVDQLEYFYGDRTKEFKNQVLGPAQEIGDYIREISLDKKIEHARIIQRWEERQKIKDKSRKKA